MKPTLRDLQQAWIDEAEAIDDDDDDRAAACCADLPEELIDVYVDAELDSGWDEQVYYWDCFIFQKNLRLAMERSCNNGLLLPDDMRVTRLLTCPPKMVLPMNYFIEQSPMHVQQYLFHFNYWLVRIERAKRSGTIDWNPLVALSGSKRASEEARAEALATPRKLHHSKKSSPLADM